MATITRPQNRKETQVRTEAPEKIREDLMRPLPRPTFRLITIIVMVIVVYVWGMIGTNASPVTLIEGVPQIFDFIGRLLPPEFEFESGSERVISLIPFEIREPVVLSRVNDGLDDLNRAREDDLAALEEWQVVQFLYRGDDRRYHFTPEDVPVETTINEAGETVVSEIEEVPFIRGEDQYLYIDPGSNDVFALDEGTRFENEFAIPDGQVLVARRYLINAGEIFIGWPVIIDAVIVTIQMALIGTTGGILLSIPFALLAARNTTPHPRIYQITRLFLNANRAVPELIWALIMVVAVGLGTFAGVTALMIGSIGSLGKLFAESIEAIDPQQVAAVRATGASQIQVFNYSVMPQAFPLLASYSLLVFESNVRAASILGYVGAGGVGLLLQKYFALFQYQQLIGAVLGIIVFVTIIDRFSDYIRKRII
ncbi:MAG: phosphonate ABC transporter, permease protein PhnE [Chloroflexi bacterium]|nr:phosphonate ABC transporter, permease protein PhnE [Chloroflexota bacterium]